MAHEVPGVSSLAEGRGVGGLESTNPLLHGWELPMAAKLSRVEISREGSRQLW